MRINRNRGYTLLRWTDQDLNFCSFSYVQLWGYRQILSFSFSIWNMNSELILNSWFRWRNLESLRHLYIPLSELLWGSNGTMCKKCLLYTICSINGSCSVAQSCPTLCNPMNCSMPGFPVFHHLPDLAHTHVHWVSDAIHHLILCCPLLLPPSVVPSIRVFSSDSVLCIRWPKYWSFSFSISPSNEYSGLISFRIDWLDLLLGSYFNDVICVFIYLQRGIY